MRNGIKRILLVASSLVRDDFNNVASQDSLDLEDVHKVGPSDLPPGATPPQP